MSQKNFRKIPPGINLKLKRIPKDEVIVGCIRKIADLRIQEGAFSHLGIPFAPGGTNSVEVIPPETSGKFSARNINGEEIIRSDLPKETHYNYVESPNWGDDSNGTHEVPLPYEKYPRDFIPPRNTPIAVEFVSSKDGVSIYKFVVREVIKKTDEKRLFECLNLLQENVGVVDIYPADYDFAQYLSTLQIAWEILPPGQRDRIMARLAGGRVVSPEKQQLIEDRYNFLLSLNPTQILVGTSGMQRYLGGMLKPDFVLFENIEYGNAIYSMYEDWEQLSKRSRVELLSGRFGTNFDRIVHSPGWKGRVKRLVAEKLK
ncbi:MAG: hypothetical protein ACOZE5_07690 [Verrucomicrobiota bacterium]